MSNKRRDRLREPSEPDEQSFQQERSSRKHDRKDAQLCAQAREALSLALGRYLDDDLDGAWICDVTPSPHIGHLQVIVIAARGADPMTVERKLTARAAALRRELASAIHRKKTPTLSFVALPTPVGPNDIP